MKFLGTLLWAVTIVWLLILAAAALSPIFIAVINPLLEKVLP